MFRIVIGYDGSAQADDAVALVGSVPWPDGLAVRLVTAVPDAAAVRSAWGRAIVGPAASLTHELEAAARTELDTAVGRLVAAGVDATGATRLGRPADVVVDEVRAFGADLVALGTRGRGQAAAALLGSVSSEILDRMPCPVLVARRPTVDAVVVGTDGSATATAAVELAGRLPVARQVPVVAVAVASFVDPLLGLPPAASAAVIEWHLEARAAAERAFSEAASEAARHLRGLGVAAESELRSGDPATELADAAASLGSSPLIVVGSRGRTGIARLVLGSVARALVTRAGASVLVVGERPSAA